MSRKNGSQKQEPQHKMDSLKWMTIFLLIVAGVYANGHYSEVAWALRAAAGIVLAAILVAIVLQTAKGQVAWAFIKGARSELRKVVWPTRQETIQTTMIVVVMVIITALILWGIDALFFWAVKSLSL